MPRWSAAPVLGLLLWALAGAAPAEPGPESLRLRLVNAPGGLIEASADQGHTWRLLGHVTHPAGAVNPVGYTASAWAHDSSIAATAVNALHIKVANAPTGRGITISIVPNGLLVGAALRQLSSTIFTDIPGGASLFGGGLGPYVDSPVYLASGETLASLPPSYVPHIGDVLLIVRHEPLRLPLTATFENRAGGAIELDYGQGPPVRVGTVEHPAGGIGRFEGEVYCAAGRIRANHPGVLDVSTSPLGRIGGFQIIPIAHAASSEMLYARNSPQWMIIRPEPPDARGWAGEPPFFAETILPSFRPDDVTGGHEDWLKRVLSRTLVEVRYEGGPWEPMPRIAFAAAGRRDNEQRTHSGRQGLWLIPAEAKGQRLPAQASRALAGITHFRIVFPLRACPL